MDKNLRHLYQYPTVQNLIEVIGQEKVDYEIDQYVDDVWGMREQLTAEAFCELNVPRQIIILNRGV